MVPKDSRKYLLDHVVGAGRNLVSIRLVKADPSPDDEDIVLGDLAECDFAGYAAQTPTWGASTLDGAFVASAETGVLEWEAGLALGSPQTIYGVYAILSVGGTDRLIWWDRLDASVTLALAGQKFRRACKMQDTNYAP